MEQKHCAVASWCTEGSKRHTRHQATLGTWIGSSVTALKQGPASVQLIIYGSGETDVRPVVAVVGPDMVLRQLDAELTWVQLAELAGALSLALVRHGSRR